MTLMLLPFLVGCGEFIVIGPNGPLEFDLRTGDKIQISPGNPEDQVTSENVDGVGWIIGAPPDPAVLVGLPEPEDFRGDPNELHLFYEAVGPGQTVVGLGLQDLRQSGVVVAGGLTYSFTVTGDAIADPGVE